MLTRRTAAATAACVTGYLPNALSVAALYRFTRFDDCASLRDPLLRVCLQHSVFGTLLLAPEGINGTIAGSSEAITAVLNHIRALPGCADIDVKLSRAATSPFYRMKVRLKREIVTMGEPTLDPRTDSGTYVDARDWNALIADPATIVIDTRNRYEIAIGTFDRAIDPGTATFRDFPDWFRRERNRLLGSGKLPRVAMFCTGGIRCEKATAFLKQEGVGETFHLRGGILKYLEDVPEGESMWRGECFVFDQRVSVGHGLSPGTHSLCHACRRAVGPEELSLPNYETGVSCAACRSERTAEQRASYRERHRQEVLGSTRGYLHVSTVMHKLPI